MKLAAVQTDGMNPTVTGKSALYDNGSFVTDLACQGYMREAADTRHRWETKLALANTPKLVILEHSAFPDNSVP